MPVPRSTQAIPRAFRMFASELPQDEANHSVDVSEMPGGEPQTETFRAPELMIPAEVVVVDKVPVLGSGKLDYVGIAALVKERITTAAVAPAAE